MNEVCKYHPTKQVLVGVCHFCLNDKLLVIASSQQEEEVRRASHSRKPSNGGLLAFGSLLSRLELCRSHRPSQSHWGTCDFDRDASQTQSTSPSLQDSFLSIKFEENGVYSWDATTDDHKGLYKEGNWKSYSNKSVGEYTTMPPPQGSLRWRKRIGHLLQLVRGKRFKKHNNGGVSHDSCVDGLAQVLKVSMD